MATETGSDAPATTATPRCPLYASVASVNAILNDGISPSTVTLRVINVLDAALTLSADSELILSFDMGPTTAAHALATEGQVQGFEVAVDDIEGYRVTPRPTFNSPTSWSIKPTGDGVIVPSHGGIELTVSGIVTDHPPGGTNAYIDFRNIDGQDGRLVVTLQKVELEGEGAGAGDSALADERFSYDAAYLLQIDQDALAALRKVRAVKAFEAAEARRRDQAKKVAEAEKKAAMVKAVAGEDTSEIVHVTQFDGSSSIDLGPGIQLGAPFTVEMWIKPSNLGGGRAVLGMRKPGTQRDSEYGDPTPIWLNNSPGLYFGFTVGPGQYRYLDPTIALSQDKWAHIALTFDGETATWFVDGEKKSSEHLGAIPDNSLPIHLLGAHYNDATRDWFNGAMAELRVWKVVRLVEELQSGMHQRLLGNEDGLLAYFPLNQIANGKVKDLVAGVEGTIQGNLALVRTSTEELGIATPTPPDIPAPPAPPAPVIDDLAQTGPLDLFDTPPLDEPGFLVPAVGVLVRSEQCWYSQGVKPGQLLYSTGLSPGESTSITVTHAATDHDTVAVISATAGDETRAHAPAGSRPFEAACALPTPIAAATGGGRGLAERTNKEITARIQNQVSRARGRLPAVSESSGQGAGQRVVTNHSSSRAMSALYYAAVHHYRVVTRATRYERLLFVPMKELDPMNVYVQARVEAALWDLEQRRLWAQDPSAARQATNNSDTASVSSQLSSDPLFVSQLVWTQSEAQEWRRRLCGLTYQGQAVDDMLDPTPVAVMGNYVGFRWRFDDDLDKIDWLLKNQLLDRDFRAWLQEHGYSDTDADLTRASSALKRDYLDQGMPQGDEGVTEAVVPVPTGGILADGMLGPTSVTRAPDQSAAATSDGDKAPS